MQSEDRANEVANLLVRVYEIYALPARFPLDEVIDYCVSIAEENLRQSHGEDITPRTISEIAAWFEKLLGMSDSA